ncbi:hypothetical protein AMATHDRAFT_43550 [Amanita thiersii Skay4041]|uniref:Uncharacterized protein n=1 Tax=Amanita thiersii Skay4041 TaxID=703135 RepID=A0A2A9N7P5_9AGAR|nr:hypothetical protein AMATHDRAFT_43550 [Amanita thiersii Skay4041]
MPLAVSGLSGLLSPCYPAVLSVQRATIGILEHVSLSTFQKLDDRIIAEIQLAFTLDKSSVLSSHGSPLCLALCLLVLVWNYRATCRLVYSTTLCHSELSLKMMSLKRIEYTFSGKTSFQITSQKYKNLSSDQAQM